VRLRTAAWLNVIVHAIGLVLALGMRPGTGAFSVGERMAFLARAPIAWTAGWGVWMVCALALGGFFVILSGELANFNRTVARAALLCVGVALAVDLFCDAAQIAVLPLAARGDAAQFLVVERWVGIGGTLVANGLYTLGAVVVSLSLSRARERWLGLLLGVAGGAMAIGGVLGSARLIEVATGPTIILYCGWALAVASSLDR
jgi:hypothetical protein